MINPTLYLQRIKNKKRTPLKVYWYRYKYPDQMNFGDEITPYIIRKLWGRECEWAAPNECELAGAGSIIEVLQHESKGNKIKVWGSGFIREGEINKSDNLDFYAIRGPKSLSRIKQFREVALGDPGILASLVFKRSHKAIYNIGVVVHYVDENNPALDVIKNNPAYKIINPLNTPEKVAQDITSCRFILSSSLHGLIFADSYKIPNYWMPLSDKLTGGDYKFNDYYASTKRLLIKQPTTILGDEEAIEKAIKAYVSIPYIKQMQRKLIKSFPKDLV